MTPIIIGFILLLISCLSYPLLVKPMVAKYGKMEHSRTGTVIIHAVKFFIYGCLVFLAGTLMLIALLWFYNIFANNYWIVGIALIILTLAGVVNGNAIWKRKKNTDTSHID